MSTNFTIESGVPIPEKAAMSNRARYPLEKLGVNQSFLVPISDPKRAKNLRSSFAVRAKKLGIKIVSVADETGVRVWRTQ
jgi:hypothetical protein